MALVIPSALPALPSSPARILGKQIPDLFLVLVLTVSPPASCARVCVNVIVITQDVQQ